jgi:hypothetical protein
VLPLPVFVVVVIVEMGSYFLPDLGSDLHLPDLCLLSSWDHRHVIPHLAVSHDSYMELSMKVISIRLLELIGSTFHSIS